MPDRPRLPRLAGACALLLATPAWAGPLAEPVRLGIAAFGTQAEVEVRDLPAAEAEAAARAALLEIHEVERLTDPAADVPGGVATLNAAAGKGPLPVEPRLFDLLHRMLLICRWSNGAHGPLGGELTDLWADRDSARRAPPGELRMAVVRADCSRAALRNGDGGTTVELAAGSRVDLSPFARGYAVDRAAEVLREQGAENALVVVDEVRRGLGDGPSGNGWPVRVLPRPDDSTPVDEVWLRDQAVSVATADGSGTRDLTPIDQRTGVPARGVVGVVAVTELAVEAEALAQSLFILGLHEGQLRLGSLDPHPSVYWLLGQGTGEAVESSYNWSVLEQVRR